MKYIFIDTENVQQYNFIENIKLSENDKIVMLISENTKNIKPEDLKIFTACKAEIQYEHVYIGERNALDFQLIINLALTIATNQTENIEYFIVSNDKDFELPAKYLIDKTKANIQILKTATNQLESFDISEELYNKLNLNKKVLKVIKNSETLSELHNNLNNLLGSEKGKEIYKEIKPIFKNKDTNNEI